MQLVSWAFVTLDEMKRYLGEDEDTTTHNDLLIALINGSSSFMERHTDRRLVAADYTSADVENGRYDGDNSKELVLKQYPINSVSSVVVSGTTISAAGSTDYYGSTGYLIYSRRGILFYENGWDQGKQNIRVSYNAGYAEGTREYYELQQLCFVLVARVFNNRRHLGFKSETIMNYRYTLADLATEQAGLGNLQNVLNSYRRKIVR